MPRICRLTSIYTKNGVAEHMVLSSYSSLSRGWTFRAICSQNPELMLESCAPKSVNVITFSLSTMMEASLDIPPGEQLGPGSRMGLLGSPLVGLSIGSPVYWSVPVQGQGGNVGGYCWLGQLLLVGVSCIPSVLPWLV